MPERLIQGGRHAWNRLTVIKLALQMLERTSGLSEGQCRLVRTAIEATDALTAELADQPRAMWSARESAQVPAQPAMGIGHRVVARAEGLGTVGMTRWRERVPQPLAAMAMLIGLLLLLLILPAAGLAVLLGVAVVLGTLLWLNRR